MPWRGTVYQKDGWAGPKILRLDGRWQSHEVAINRGPSGEILQSRLDFAPRAKPETPNPKRETPNAKRYLRSSQITSGPRIDPDGFALFDKERDLD
jgi:hypothetical protein